MKNTKKILPSVVASILMAGSAQAAISGDTVKLGYLADMSGGYWISCIDSGNGRARKSRGGQDHKTS